MILVSIVIPVHNNTVEILDTLNSVLSQCIEEIELIIVDDGSTDGTLKVIRDYTKNSCFYRAKIILISQKHLGVSVARNKGLSVATGDYLVFFDSDDKMEHGFLRKMYDEAIYTSAEVVMCGYYLSDENGEIIRSDKRKYSYFGKTMSGREACLLFLKDKLPMCTGNTLYKINFLRKYNILYQNGATHGEDQEFGIKSLYLANKVVFIKEELVNYVQRKESATHSINLLQFNYIGSMLRVKKFFEDQKAPTGYIDKMDYIKIPQSYLDTITALCANGLSIITVYRLFRNKFIINKILNLHPMTSKAKLKYILFRLSPILYLLLIKIRSYIRVKTKLCGKGKKPEKRRILRLENGRHDQKEDTP